MSAEQFEGIDQFSGIGNITLHAAFDKVIFKMIMEKITVLDHMDASLMKSTDHVHAENLTTGFKEDFIALLPGAEQQIALVVQRAQDNLVIHVSNKGCQSMKCVSRFHMMTSLLF